MPIVTYLTEDEYSELQDEFDIHKAESGIDREYYSDSELECMFYNFIDLKLGGAEWELLEADK